MLRSVYTGGMHRLPIGRLVAAALLLLLAACGHSTQLHPSYPVLTMSASNGGLKFASYIVRINSMTLTADNGVLVSLAAPTNYVVDLARLADVSELVQAYSVPYGTYKSASIVLDYNTTVASMSVNINGNAVPATFMSNTGTALATVSVTVTFDPAKPLVLSLQQATPVHINLDLAAFNSIDTSAAIPKVTVQPYAVMTPAAVDATPLRARGSFVSVQGGAFVINLRPFYNLAAQTGAVIVTPTADAYYNVQGVVYTGAAGLAAMAAQPLTTVVAAYGTLTGTASADPSFSTNPTFSAKEIYVGSSQENGLSYVSGLVSARSGNTLTVHGATLNYVSGSTTFYNGSVVRIAAGIPVSQDGMDVSGLSAQSISVGQYVYLSGTATTDSNGAFRFDASGNLLFDATLGTARLLHTRLWGTLSASTPTKATFDLLTLGIYAPSAFNFTGTGATPANPAAYRVNTGTLDLSGTAVNTLMAIDGATTPFGAAPPDFNAAAVTAGSQTEQQLVVEWPSGEVAPFSSANSSGYVVDLAKASVGSTHAIYTGPAGMDLKSLPASPLITTTGANQGNLDLSVGSTTLTTGVSVYASAAAYNTAVTATFNGTNKVHRLVAVGSYNSVSNTFVAQRILMALQE